MFLAQGFQVGMGFLYPIGLMYGIFAYIYHKNQPNVGRYTGPMDPTGRWYAS